MVASATVIRERCSPGSGIVHQYIDTTEAFLGGVDEADHIPGPGDVCLTGEYRNGQFIGEFGKFRPHVTDRQCGALGRQGTCERISQANGRSCDQGYFSIQKSHYFSRQDCQIRIIVRSGESTAHWQRTHGYHRSDTLA